MTNTDIAAAFFSALAAEDEQALRAICSYDVKPQQNGGPPLTLDTLLGFAKAVHSVVADFRYAEVVRSETSSGFVQEHVIRGALPNGKEVALAVCVVGDVQNGKITSVREYFDSASAADVLGAMQRNPISSL